ncbi:hypothetical protein BCR39DRAFT_536228 [Naematelia encephala]|uniref:Uncharacterized protein n=1 Tax=Naematelia encephala TaxID=71784 RepID=A0A1Y2AZM5_9TREE|nr:hypothetical protein BCR39DRAFT_536228 [Naematelia encephala]
MQSIIDTASNLTTSAAQTLGLQSSNTTTTTAGHQDNQGYQHSTPLPPDSTAYPIRSMDTEGLAVFEDERVRHEVLVKINQLAIEDIRHGLKQLETLDLVVQGAEKKGIDYYHPKRYFTVDRPMGVDYIGEIEIEQDKSIHVRCHKPSVDGKPTFHSLDTRPTVESGAVFKTGGPLGWFDY